MSQKPKIAKAVITIYDDGSYHIQDLHSATSQTVTLDDDPSGGLDDGGGNNPVPPPKDP